ncbi:hypothetical protein EDC55_10251 [Allofrancisella inopinata]|uniref:Uncharacterized protein n=1 Tax=Allofrancisella inopinata TaxID=1085647 RepID=A0AAE6YHL7_9GAMM|nr:hypothetical protein [Allofrancisella inopinata]QIV95945.1 hypothetical protein E4K63_03515 [Allofrancisella inopinata]TDT74365.1 hypothetical protein EDC55_10251 [Allofrancisella inopinata]
MFLLAIHKDKLQNNTFTATDLRNITQSDIDQPSIYNEEYYMIPWFSLYKPEEIINDFLTYAYEFEMLDANLIEPTVLKYKDIYIQQCLIYFHPILGKVPEQPLTNKVSANILTHEGSINKQLKTLYTYLSKKNGGLTNLPTEEVFNFKTKQIINNEIFLDLNNDMSFINEAEYFITYPSIQLAFKHIAMKARNIATGNFARTKLLVEKLIKDENDQLYKAQVQILKKWKNKYQNALSALSPEKKEQLEKDFKIKEPDLIKKFNKIPLDKRLSDGKEITEELFLLGQKEKDIKAQENQKLTSSLGSNEYYKYYQNLKDNKITNALKSFKTFELLLNEFIEDFPKIGKQKNNIFNILPKVAIGAMLINDTRKIITSVLEKHKDPVKESTVYTGSNWNNIIREKYKLGVLGKAPSNNMTYNHYSKPSNIVAARNKACYETGMMLGNGVSGHMASILDIHDCQKPIEKMTVACSMLIFWDKFYDRQVTNAHSYIEIFESIMYEEDYNNQTPKLVYPNISGNVFNILVRYYDKKMFNPIDTLSFLTNTSLQKKSLLNKSNRSIDDNSISTYRKFSKEEIDELSLALKQGGTVYLY